MKVATIFSHLNCSDMPQEDRYTREQIARFDRMSGRLAAALPYPVLRHTANSAAIERFPEAQFDMCRLGLGLYGFGFEHAAVNLTAELDKRLSAYSGGMKQRLLLASALLGDPKLLILDEPTAGLDPKERVRLRELLADMAKDRIILVATHVVSDVETVATKVILLRAGKIVDAAPVPELIEKYAPGQGLEDVYLNVFGEGDGK